MILLTSCTLSHLPHQLVALRPEMLETFNFLHLNIIDDYV